jgi:hypothetical protein
VGKTTERGRKKCMEIAGLRYKSVKSMTCKATAEQNLRDHTRRAVAKEWNDSTDTVYGK